MLKIAVDIIITVINTTIIIITITNTTITTHDPMQVKPPANAK